jgi:hypothetical protein
MADLQPIFLQPGPLPLKTTVNIQSNMPAVVTLAGSVWSNAAQKQIGIALLIDGEVAAIATVFANPGSQHMAVVPVEIAYTFDIGPHDFVLNPLNNATTSDQNDSFCVTVQY